MAHRFCGLALILSAPLVAGTIDVSTQFSTTLDTGDALSFSIPAWNFTAAAAKFGLPLYPTYVQFTLESAPQDSQTMVEAFLQSADGSVSVSFGAPLSSTPGAFQGALYDGSVSVLEGSLHLSETLSQQLFGSSPASLVLLATGPALTVGLPPYTIEQDLSVSLGGGGLSVGAPVGKVVLADAPLGGSSLMDPSGLLDSPDAPEPQSGLLMLGGGTLLWAFARLRRS